MAEPPRTAVSFFPGCSAHGTGVEYAASARSVCAALGIDLLEIPDWSCCGSTSAHALDHDLGLALAARNLAIAEKAGLEELVTPCPACFARLRGAAAQIASDGPPTSSPEVRGTVRVAHLLDLIAAPPRLAALETRVGVDLGSLRVVPYYGCLAVRPPALTGCSDPENPTTMDTILGRVGADVASWPWKTRCCGSSLALTRTEIVTELTTEIVAMARRAGADIIVTACPLCFVNLDTRQSAKPRLPVMYFTELLAIAMGLEGSRRSMKRHLISPERVLADRGLLR